MVVGRPLDSSISIFLNPTSLAAQVPACAKAAKIAPKNLNFTKILPQHHLQRHTDAWHQPHSGTYYQFKQNPQVGALVPGAEVDVKSAPTQIIFIIIAAFR